MNSLDQKLDMFAQTEPSAADVQDAQRKLEARIAAATPVRRTRRVTGWLAATASAIAAVAAFVWLPFSPNTALAFSQVQKHFLDFKTLRFDMEQRMDGKLIMRSRISLLADGSVRAEVGDDVTVVVNTQEKRVITLLKPSRMAVVSPLDGTPKKDDSLEWLDEVRQFQGKARKLPEAKFIRGQVCQGWELPMEQGKIVLWANNAGLPVQMQLDQGVALDLSFEFEFEPRFAADTFSTAVPAGYELAESED
jgi:hypothetical protein